ncbi:unnamed protein product [Cylindrotheca closterium]|uniref:Uncharacterized protein n=1 Tax=Cylindrotheca closterium TaxID=2856 RepID=A0AAD2G403_9STRA|nr:unnamed protein product [Cylindrotheca closterium]
MNGHGRTTEDGDAPAILPRRVDQDQGHESVPSMRSLNNGITPPLASPKQTPAMGIAVFQSLPIRPPESDMKPLSIAESSVATGIANSVENRQMSNDDGDEASVATTITEPLAVEDSGMRKSDATTQSDTDEGVDTNNDHAMESEAVFCEDTNDAVGANDEHDVSMDDSTESTVESNAEENFPANGENTQEQDETNILEESDMLVDRHQTEEDNAKDDGTLDATAVAEDVEEHKEVQEDINEESDLSGNPDEGIPSEQEDEIPRGPTTGDAVLDIAEDEMDLPLGKVIQEKQKSAQPLKDDAQELQGEGSVVVATIERSQPEDTDIDIVKPHETEADKEVETSATPKELQNEEPVEIVESTPLDPLGGVPGAEPSGAEFIIASGDESSLKAEKEDDGVSGVAPPASDSSDVINDGQETLEHDPNSSQLDKSETVSMDPEETVGDEGVSAVRNLKPHQEAQGSEELPATLKPKSSDTAPPTDSSNKVSSLPSTSGKIRVPRKKGLALASGGSDEGDEENGFDAGTNAEIVERKRPANDGNLYTLRKPDRHLKNGGAENDEHAQAAASDDAGDEQNLFQIPRAFIVPPSQHELVETNYYSDAEGSGLTEAETVTTAVLAEEYNEDEPEANRLENERLRREVRRRERETAAVVVAVRSNQDGDDGQKGNVEVGSSTRKLKCLALFLLLIGGCVAAFFLLRPDDSESAVTAAPTSDLPCVLFVSESPLLPPFSECQGDCDSDLDCEDGLECFQRDEFESVPGCSCGEIDPSRSDYCVKKKGPPLSISDQVPLGICQGDCDEDSHCGLGLICHQRSGGEPVPGCSGGETEQSNTDYCVKDTKEEPEEPQFLGLCEGQCQDDSSCEPGLFCYQRDEMGQVPGCTDIVENASADRFCVSGVYQVADTDELPLPLCRGDCDDDTDCEDGLFCFQRSGGDGQQVPGCIGGLEESSNSDFCIREIYREFIPFYRWGDRLVGLPKEKFGTSVSLSGDGQILAVGTIDDESVGYVDVYKATESGAAPSTPPSVIWTQLTRLMGEAVGEAFGSKVALSADGQTLVVGNLVDIPTTARRAARIQVFQARTTSLGSNDADFGNWTIVEAYSSNGNVIDMIGDEYDIDDFEFSVAISDDGKYVALGQPSNGGEKLDSIQRGPLVYRKDRQDDGADVMTFLGAPYARLYAGSSVKIATNADGNPRVATGGDNSVRGDGQVRVKELMADYNSNSINQVQVQPGDETESLGWFEVATNSIGQSDNTAVDMSSDGNILALAITNRTSLFYDNADGTGTEIVSWNGPEHVIVYRFKEQGVDDYWDQIGNLIPVSTSQVEDMPTVALSDDGQLLVVGEPWFDFNTGRVRVFKYAQRSDRWVPLQAPLVGLTVGERFGSTLSLVGSASGESESFTLAIGGPSEVGRGLVECYQILNSLLLSESSSVASKNLEPKSTSRIQGIAWDLVWSP